jgi:hypothetical protein
MYSREVSLFCAVAAIWDHAHLQLSLPMADPSCAGFPESTGWWHQRGLGEESQSIDPSRCLGRLQVSFAHVDSMPWIKKKKRATAMLHLMQHRGGEPEKGKGWGQLLPQLSDS